MTAVSAVSAEETAQEPSWKSGPVASLKQIDLGSWEFTDDTPADARWEDKYGNKNSHKYPPCFQLDLGENDVTTGRGYILKDIAPMFGSAGLLQDGRNNLDRLMSSPLMIGTEIVHEATGGPIEVDFLFGSGGFGNRLCYYYAPAEAAVDKDTRALVKAFAKDEIPTFCIDPQMRASKHMNRWKKNAAGEWEMLDKSKDHFDNDHLGRVLRMEDTNYGSWGDDLITGAKFRLKYYGPTYDQEPTDNFPAGTRIYFFLVTYNDGDWNGELNEDGTWKDTRLPYSVKFASRALNAEFGKQGNWWDLDNHREYGDQYGTGAMAAAAINYWLADSNTGESVNLNLLSWEDNIQPEMSGENFKANSDYDMGDVAFYLTGVKNPVTDIDETNPLSLRVDPWSSYDPANNTNYYTHWLNLVNDGGAPIRSCDLQPVTFKDGNLVPSYTWVSVSQYENDGNTARPIKYLVIKKSATLDGREAGKYQASDLIDENLRIKLEFAYVNTYGQDLSGVSFKETQGEFKRGTNDDTNVDFSSLCYEYEHNVTATGSHPWKYGYQMSFALNGGKIRATNQDKVMIPRSEIIVDPRGTAEAIDFADKDEKHFTDLPPEIKNRMYVTVRCANVTNMDGKDQIKAVALCGTRKLNHYKDGNMPGVSDNVLCVITRGDDNNWTITGNNGNYRLAGVSEHDDAQWLVLEADLVPSDVHAVIYSQVKDTKNNQIDNNYYGIAPKGCVLPKLKFDVDLHFEGEAFTYYDEVRGCYPALFQGLTTWSIDGLDDQSGVLFNQWRKYDKVLYQWGGTDDSYLNILHGVEPRSGSIPAELYTPWLGYCDSDHSETISSNDLTYADGCWSNHDVLVNPFDEKSHVTSNYLLRAYYVPAAPKDLPQTRAAGNNFIVLEARKLAEAQQRQTTGIENVGSDTDADATPVYYNLQGIQTASPVAGQTYIVVRGNKTTKEVFRL
ncbi:MAG: hypothetical protein K2O10_06020 [Muribaculaceae bacterium]|nr:hypothetical protein [Muribaculaceae bacterium]